MTYTITISSAELAQHLHDPSWAIVDCRFKLGSPAEGRSAYVESHIPGAVYAHLDEDLSGPIIPGETGRHPLPTIETFAKQLSEWGIDANTQVIAYDDNSSVYAGRLWWMLRWLGHDKVAVLDGDWRQWQQEGRPTSSGVETRPQRTFVAQPRPEMQVSVADVTANVQSRASKMFDSRDESRYRGEPSPMDPVSGHIPGAQSAWYARNLDANGKFLPADQLRARFAALLGDAAAEDTIFYCGSGVSVHNNLLALALAGYGTPRVYIGSWSDWITDASRPVATGEE